MLCFFHICTWKWSTQFSKCFYLLSYVGLLVVFPRKPPLHGRFACGCLSGGNSWEQHLEVWKSSWDGQRDKLNCSAVATEVSEYAKGESEAGMPFREVPVEKMGLCHCTASLHCILGHCCPCGGAQPYESQLPSAWQILGRTSVLNRGE